MGEPKGNSGWIQPVVQGASGAIGMGIEGATANQNADRNYHQQKKLTAMQVRAEKELGEFNQKQSMEMWNATNYEAQRAHMENAGLNVGLMYGGGGGGGATAQGGSAGSTGAGTPVIPDYSRAAGMGIQAGAQAARAAAEIANIKADTEKKTVEANKLRGVDTEKTGAEVTNIIQQTANAELNNSIMQFEKTLKEIDANVAGKTQEEIIQQMKTATEKLIAEANSAKAKGEIDQATKDEVIKGAELANEAAKTGIEATKTGIEATKAGTEQTKQNTLNLQQDEIYKKLENGLKENGLEKGDPAIMRMMSQWLKKNNISMDSISKKMGRIASWLKGEGGEQTWEKFEQIMRE